MNVLWEEKRGEELVFCSRRIFGNNMSTSNCSCLLKNKKLGVRNTGQTGELDTSRK